MLQYRPPAVHGVDWHNRLQWKGARLIWMPELSERRNDFHQSGLEFINTELDTGLTFVRIALGARGRNKIERNRVNARKAYDSALHFLPTASLSAQEARMVKEKIASLEAGLTKLGEVL
ncbi:MAG TPA: hypothetical protein VJ848_12870 [Candidatus Angelobacter sp.]|nr:hypothetical protein [Candidatus Angelobacter sp.]